MNTEKRNIWFLIALAVLFRLLLLQYRLAVSFDEPHYLQMAASLASGNWSGILHPYWSPGYPLVAGLLSFFIKNYEYAGRLANILLGSLMIYPVFLMSRRIWNQVVGYLAGAFIAFYPSLAFLHTSALAEPAYMFFSFLGVWLGWQTLETGNWRSALAAGICWGMAYLTKPEGVGFLLVFVGMVAGYFLFRLWKKQQKRELLRFLLAPVGFLLVALGYLIYLHGEAGYWTLSAKGLANQQFEAVSPENGAIFETLDENNTSFLMDEIYHTGTFLRQVQENGPKVQISVGALLRKYLSNIFRILKYGVPSTLTLPILILFSLGLFARPWPAASILPAIYVLTYVVFYWFGVVPLFHINERYILSLLPAIAIWVGAGIVVLAEWFSEQVKRLNLWNWRPSWLGGSLVAIFIFLLSFSPELGKILQDSRASAGEWGVPVELKMAGEWLKKHADKKPPIVMSYNKAVDFYAGNYEVRFGVSFSKDASERVLAYARNRNVGYFVITERYLRRFPNLKTWVYDKPPSALELIHEVLGPDGVRAWVFTWASSPS
jgi:4-amino-4-deoxy-L-arabinose transferase-like glycosyltransferase